MTINEVREAIYQYFQTGWTFIMDDKGNLILDDNNQPLIDDTVDASTAGPPRTYENEAFNPESLSDQVWMRIGVRNTTSIQETLGNVGTRQFLRKGFFYAQIFSPINKGLKQADLAAEELRSLFEGKTISGIRFWAADVNEGIDDAPWKQTNVQIPFDYNQEK